MKPSINRSVHYRSYGTPNGEYGSECRAAVITEIHGEGSTTVGLAVFNPTGLFFNRSVDQGPAAGQWHWPERVD